MKGFNSTKELYLFLGALCIFNVTLITIIHTIFAFPYSLIASILTFVVAPMLILRYFFGKLKQLGELDSMFNGGKVHIKYRCLTCNMIHNCGTCPRCGSNIHRTEF